MFLLILYSKLLSGSSSPHCSLLSPSSFPHSTWNIFISVNLAKHSHPSLCKHFWRSVCLAKPVSVGTPWRIHLQHKMRFYSGSLQHLMKQALRSSLHGRCLRGMQLMGLWALGTVFGFLWTFNVTFQVCFNFSWWPKEKKKLLLPIFFAIFWDTFFCETQDEVHRFVLRL